jgi:hypothetical protein
MRSSIVYSEPDSSAVRGESKSTVNCQLGVDIAGDQN